MVSKIAKDRMGSLTSSADKLSCLLIDRCPSEWLQQGNQYRLQVASLCQQTLDVFKPANFVQPQMNPVGV